MKQRILAIDDEPDLLRLLERIITDKTPYEIKITNNSLEVPQILNEEQFDLIISDLKMPGMDGLDILKYVKSQDRFEQVVIITAFGTLDTAIEALSQGVFDYITKPFKKEQIIYTIDRVMKYQKLKLESIKINRIFEILPYAEAEKAFKNEYITRLLKRYPEVKSAAEASELSFDFLAEKFE